MKITLPAELREFVELKVRSGRYDSSDEVIRDALQTLMDHDAAAQSIRSAIDESRSQLRRGEGISGSQMTVARIRSGALRRFGPPRKRKAS